MTSVFCDCFPWSVLYFIDIRLKWLDKLYSIIIIKGDLAFYLDVKMSSKDKIYGIFYKILMQPQSALR